MIDTTQLTNDLRAEVTLLVDDLRVRADTVDEIADDVRREWTGARDAGRTAHDLETWREDLLTQVAVSWVLACVFVRYCEDQRLWPVARLSGPGDQRRRAVEEQTAFFREHPAAGERDWLRHVFTEAAALPGLDQVLGEHNPVWRFGPSDDACRHLLDLWREIDPATGELRRDFTGVDTRFLGDLYQDLSEHAKKTYALLQTPDFVEELILDRTLEPALDEFGLDGFRVIDPACGSGHFLLGSFDRIFDRWEQRTPHDGARANAAKALRSLYGIDLNPFAASIARFRLLVAALRAAGVPTLAEAPSFEIQIAVGDSLRHGPPPGRLFDRMAFDVRAQHLYADEDGDLLTRYLTQRYHAVVANPPYITPKDPAANAAYRDLYDTCHRQYSLSVPFMERLFDLAERGAPGSPGGYVGQITANSFMKREFGKKLIEDYLAHQVDLTHVIDTSGAYIPGHGTPTVILVGRNQQPTGSTVRAVLGIRGEPGRPSEPAKGLVWRSIVDHLDDPGEETEYVSVTDLDRDRLRRHPWSLQGGGAANVKDLMERTSDVKLGSRISLIGRTAHTSADDAYFAPPGVLSRRGFPEDQVVEIVEGDRARDWRLASATEAVFPYDSRLEPQLGQSTAKWLWPNRQYLVRRREPNGTHEEIGLTWFEWSRFHPERFTLPFGIAFAFVATHNHFVLDRGGKVFKQSAPVIKLPAGASERDHLELLGPLNSAIGCFWMQQVFHNKGAGGGARVAQGFAITGENYENHFEFDATKLQRFPLPHGPAFVWAERLDALAQELSSLTPAALAERTTPTRGALADARRRAAEVRQQMVAVQEELDWRCEFLYGLTSEDLSLPPDEVPAIDRGQRAFEIVLARRKAAGEVETTWFRRHGSAPITEIPADWPDHYRRLVEQRMELIESDRFIGLVERPEYKRRWNWDDWDELEQEALRSWLLDRLEEPRYWPRPTPRSVAQLADDARGDDDLVSVAELYAGTVDVDLVGLIAGLVKHESVPYLAAWRYTDSGLRKRAAWERTWELQRREDAGEEVGTIPVPPKYAKADFREAASWSLRGKLDVPKERFISYPGAERDTDATLVLGWAGWDHLQQAQALAALITERRQRDGWDGERLCPLLAGLAELVPWLRQWHNGVDPATGQRLGDFFAEFVAAETHELGLRPDELTGWRPPTTTRRRRRKTTA